MFVVKSTTVVVESDTKILGCCGSTITLMIDNDSNELIKSR